MLEVSTVLVLSLVLSASKSRTDNILKQLEKVPASSIRSAGKEPNVSSESKMQEPTNREWILVEGHNSSGLVNNEIHVSS